MSVSPVISSIRLVFFLTLSICTLMAVTVLSPAHGYSQSGIDPVEIKSDWLVTHGDTLDVATSAFIPLEETVTTLATTAPAADPYEWTQLAYQVGRDEQYDIYVSRSNGTEERRVTNDPADDGRARFNRGATQLLFERTEPNGSELFLLDMQNGATRPITGSQGDNVQGTWSPDGTNIVFVSTRDGNPELYQVNVNDGTTARLTNTPYGEINPAISPDGTQLVWISAVSETDGVLLVANRDGSNPQVISPAIRYLQHPAWSPDGTTIAFDGDIVSGDGWNDIGFINVDGTNVRALYSGGQFHEVWVSAWAPDGSAVTATQIEYKISGNRLVVDQAFVLHAPLDRAPYRVTASDLSIFPDWQTLDATAPQSNVLPLPRYSRMSDNRIQWMGTETSSPAAGLRYYDVEVKTGNGEWQPFQTHTTATSGLFSPQSGATVSFRSSATDNAYNRESTYAADTSTTFYRWNFAGTITDNRGIPIPQATVTLSPAPVHSETADIGGTFLAYTKEEGNHTFGASHSGYMSLPSTPLLINRDRIRTVYLESGENRVVNGSFEQGTLPAAGWMVTGTLGITTTANAYAGNHALQIAQLCTNPCLASEVPLIELHNYDLIVAPDGILHVVGYDRSPTGNIIYYLQRRLDGSWTTPQEIFRTVYNSSIDPSPLLLVDGTGTLHLLYLDTVGDNPMRYYRTRSPNGVWSGAQAVGIDAVNYNNHPFAVVVDDTGTLHLITSVEEQYSPNPTEFVQYYAHTRGGAWVGPQVLYESRNLYTITDFRAAVDDHNNVNFLWTEFDEGQAYFMSRSSDGSVSPVERIGGESPYGIRIECVAGDGVGGFHVVFEGIDYFYRSPAGRWSRGPYPGYSLSCQMVGASDGTVHIALNHDQGWKYRSRTGSGQWTPVVEFEGQIRNAFTNGNNQVSFFGIQPNISYLYYTQPRAEMDAFHTLQQSVLVPDEPHPTLALAYALDGFIENTDSNLEMSITDAQSTTVFYSGTVNTDYRMLWHDLTQWQGMPITVTLILHQAENEPFVEVAIDSVSISLWTTPLVETATPTTIPSNWAGQVIEISGQNFQQGTTVKIGTVTAPTQYVDAQMLRVTIPNGVRAGIYPLFVSNPDGQASATTTVRLGLQAYLPILIK